jgi:hypothetical protein
VGDRLRGGFCKVTGVCGGARGVVAVFVFAGCAALYADQSNPDPEILAFGAFVDVGSNFVVVVAGAADCVEPNTVEIDGVDGTTEPNNDLFPVNIDDGFGDLSPAKGAGIVATTGLDGEGRVTVFVRQEDDRSGILSEAAKLNMFSDASPKANGVAFHNPTLGVGGPVCPGMCVCVADADASSPMVTSFTSPLVGAVGVEDGTGTEGCAGIGSASPISISSPMSVGA